MPRPAPRHRAVLLPALLLALPTLQPAPPQLEPLQPETFAAGGTLTNAFADVDGDGDLDLFVGFNGAANRLYENARGAFRDVAPAWGVADARPTRAAAWSDYDGDGDPDLLVGFTPGAGGVLRLYRNEGGRFADVTAASGLAVDSGAVRQPAWVDVDGDGDRDLFVAFRDRPNALFRQDSAGRFTEVAASLGLADPRKSVGATWFDFEQDGDLDLVVANQDGDANGFFVNRGGRFVDRADSLGVAGGGRAVGVATQGSVRPCVADFDGDGVADLAFANYGRNGLLLGARGGAFRDVGAEWGVATEGRHDTCAPADVDHDGRLDLYVNGTVSATESWRDWLFVREGGAMADRTPANVLALNASHGAQWADVDGDGALDLALAGTRADMPHALLRNVLPPAVARRSVQVRVRAPAGAEVRVYAAGTRRRLAARWTDAGSGYDAQSMAPVHVGLPTAGRVDVEVTVPNGRTRVRTTVRNVAPSARPIDVRVPGVR
ncbi:CRTAC1 family protein [Roseisolibacter sp. H3M3-2]|uniref:CRTAC1 family protein n=1 Tax=Roseisolibacter sp. H3M3-2 TaxID=3031323 RepID=UPI0023D98A68|nr:CRTAC1 family protein [Roseisolibacter sp. H3M3-2]MDF1502366.1 CRTAC1 family protein [Roseisolibacter sp. H3M3-2]